MRIHVIFLYIAIGAFFAPICVLAQEGTNQTQQQNTGSKQDTATDQTQETEPDTTLFPHLSADRYWISGQANFILQGHPTFPAQYSGTNSLSPGAQTAFSRVLDLNLGYRVNQTTEFILDIEETGGHGIGEAFGLAGFTNLDVVRNPTLGKAPYIGRFMWHQIISLSHTMVQQERNFLSLFPQLPQRRLEFRLGKYGLADFFDTNTYGSDSHLQFMNWTVDNNGAYDYAADTRGYTYAAMLEYDDKNFSVRFAEALMPKVANGIHLDADLARARSENLEFELRGSLLPKQKAVLRLLNFVNHANMGLYRDAIANYLAGLTSVPEITAHPLQTTIKYGFGVNFEQSLNDWLGVFGRWGWNEGEHESYAYTEDDETFELGLGASGTRWSRNLDRAGVAVVSNGISRDHQEYLALGGLGFLLGDGRLNYGRENIVETYYTFHAWRGVFPSVGLQRINNPGYNRDRGPVLVPTIRLNLEF
ncbi:MAG TPA: carbohydrate porin [Candidatus Acidoferrales bacterium]|nr:carbohydrate porin [Candidatus Acidoferrales bacterium]